jgi:hypothetical protein
MVIVLIYNMEVNTILVSLRWRGFTIRANYYKTFDFIAQITILR